MGSGLLLAILVALWFVVLVPMVVTRGDLVTAPAQPTRVLRRRSDRSAMPTSATSMNAMSHRSGSGSTGAASSSNASSGPPETMRTSPIPPLPRRVPGATLLREQPPVPARPAGKAEAEPVAAGSEGRDTSARAELDIRTRRRRMLTGIVALAALWALFAIFWQPVLWWPQIVLDLGIFSYLVFLRLEAQRRQDRLDRRRARAAVRMRLPEDRTERLVRRQTEYQGQVTAATEHQAIAIDDDDPGFAEIPTWDRARESHLAAQAPAWHERKAV